MPNFWLNALKASEEVAESVRTYSPSDFSLYLLKLTLFHSLFVYGLDYGI